MTPRSKITRESLLTLETYARTRDDFRSRVLEHAGAGIVALLGVGFECQQAFPRNFRTLLHQAIP